MSEGCAGSARIEGIKERDREIPTMSVGERRTGQASRSMKLNDEDSGKNR